LAGVTGTGCSDPDRAGSATRNSCGHWPENTEDETMTKTHKTCRAILLALATAFAGATMLAGPAHANMVCTNGGCVTCDGPLVCINGACTCNGVPISTGN
jgi:hypothetical protein